MLYVVALVVAQGTTLQYQVEPLPYSFFAANNTGTVLLREFNGGRYDYWRYVNGEAKLVALGLPGDNVRLLDNLGTLYGSTDAGEGLRFDKIMLTAAKYNRRDLEAR